MKFILIIIVIFGVLGCRNESKCNLSSFNKFEIPHHKIEISLPRSLLVVDSSVVIENGPQFYARSLISSDTSEKAFISASITEPDAIKNELFHRLKSHVKFLKNGTDITKDLDSIKIGEWDIVKLTSKVENESNVIIVQIAGRKGKVLFSIYYESKMADNKLANRTANCILNSLKIYK